MGKGLVTFEQFLGCADSAFTTFLPLVHVLFSDSAQPRRCSNVTRPFLIWWVESRDETTSGPEEVRQDHVRLAFFAEPANKSSGKMYGGLWEHDGHIEAAVFMKVRQDSHGVVAQIITSHIIGF